MNVNELVQKMKVKKGDFITVNKWLLLKDRSYVGDVLEVSHVEGKFIVVNRLTGGKGAITLNLDEVEIIPISKEFKNAACNES